MLATPPARSVPGQSGHTHPIRRGLAAARILAIILLALAASGCNTRTAVSVTDLRARLRADQDAYSALATHVDLDTGAILTSQDEALAALDAAQSHFGDSTHLYAIALPSDASNNLLVAIHDANVSAGLISSGSEVIATSIRQGRPGLLSFGIAQIRQGSAGYYEAFQSWNAFAAEPGVGYKAKPAPSPEPGLRWLDLTRWTLPPVAAVAIWLAAAGWLINRSYRARVARYAEGKDEPNPLGDRGFQLAYGLHLVVLVALGYTLPVLAMVWTVDVCGWLILLPTITGAGSLPPLIALAIAGSAVPSAFLMLTVSALSIWRGVVRPAREIELGIRVSPGDQPAIWDLSRRAAAAQRASPADVVVLTLVEGTGVSMRGGMLSVLKRNSVRVLLVSSAHLVGLTVRQLETIIAHEYAHFSNRDTTWAVLTFSAAVGCSRTLTAASSFGLSRVSPVRWALWTYLWLLELMTAGFRQACETRADETAIRALGSDSFGEALVRVYINGVLLGSKSVPRMREAMRLRLAPPNVHVLLAHAYDDLTAEERDALVVKLLTTAEPARSSHPALKQRLALAARLAVPPPADDPSASAPATSLVHDWPKLSRLLSEGAHPLIGGTAPIR